MSSSEVSKIAAALTFRRTSISQVAAQKLYLKCGYKDVGHVIKSDVECILYEKSL